MTISEQQLSRMLAQRKLIAVRRLQANLERSIYAAIGARDFKSAVFVEINAMNGGYDAATNAAILEAVASRRAVYYEKKTSVTDAATIEELNAVHLTIA